MSTLRKLYRSVLFGLWLIIGVILTILFLRNTIPSAGITSNIIRKWLTITTRIFGVKIKCYGIASTQKTLFISNHISWLDVIILASLVPIHILSKLEVKTMPVFGWLATRGGTLYIKRGGKNSASDASSEITAVLKQRHNSLIFAEGTTTDGHIKKFHSRLMQSAIDADATVQPIAIFYPLLNTKTNKLEVNPAALFTGDTTIGESYDLITRTAAIEVEVHFLKPIDSTGKTRDEIAQHAYDEVVEAIKEIKTR